MTREEFEEFLKIVELRNWKGNIITSSYFFEMSTGWFSITKDLIEDLIKLGWDKSLFQAKEKFGGGRFYIGGGTTEIHDRIDEWENLTEQTCEICGEPGKIIGTSWLTCRCEKHGE